LPANYDVGWARLFGSEMGGQIAWLLPAAAGRGDARANLTTALSADATVRFAGRR
jgi:hypothetical protein